MSLVDRARLRRSVAARVVVTCALLLPAATAVSLSNGPAAASDAVGGYWESAADGGVFAFGDAPFEGSLPGDAVTVADVVGGATDGPSYDRRHAEQGGGP